MDSGNRNVERIDLSFLWNRSTCYQRTRKINCIRRRCKYRQPSHQCKSAAGAHRITSRGFLQYEWRNVQLEFWPTSLPPCSGQSLVRAVNEVFVLSGG